MCSRAIFTVPRLVDWDNLLYHMCFVLGDVRLLKRRDELVQPIDLLFLGGKLVA